MKIDENLFIFLHILFLHKQVENTTVRNTG